MNTIAVERQIWQGCAKDNSRPVLTGILVERVNDTTARLTAADGYMLASFDTPADLAEDFKPAIVPAALFKAAHKSRMPIRENGKVTTGEEEQRVFEAQSKEGIVWDMEIQGTYPDWRKLVNLDLYLKPESLLPSCNVNPELVLRARRTFGEHLSLPLLAPDDARKPWLMVHEDGLVIIMPMLYQMPDADQIESWADRRVRELRTVIAERDRQIAGFGADLAGMTREAERLKGILVEAVDGAEQLAEDPQDVAVAAG